LEALALFNELSAGLFAVRDLLTQYEEQAAATAGEPSSPVVTLKSSMSKAPDEGAGGETASVSTAGSAALDRARKASVKPGAATDDAVLVAELREKLRTTQLTLEEERATLAAERALRLEAEAKLRSLGAPIDVESSMERLRVSSGGERARADTPDIRLGSPMEGKAGSPRSAGQFLQNTVAGALAASSEFFQQIVPKPDGARSPAAPSPGGSVSQASASAE